MSQPVDPARDGPSDARSGADRIDGLVRDKAVLLTGGASGIGRAAARVLVREGARLLLSDVDEEGGEALASELRESGGEAHFQRCDVARESEVRALVEACVARLGGLDAALNNAGVSGRAALLHETPPAEFERVLAVNLHGVFLCMQQEIRQMQRQGGGAIVNTASGSGLVATPGMAPYCASKHAILGLTKTAAVENAAAGIRINAVLPGSTDTPMLRASMAGNPAVEKMILRSQPGGRLGRPEEIAEAMVWLCSDRASFVSGESMLVDGASVAR